MGLSKWEEDLLKNADAVIDKSPMEPLYAGVFFNQNRKKYWIDKATFGNCFMVFARDFSVAWGSDKRYWDWPSIKETSEVFIDVAELLQVSWLSVGSKFDTANLTVGMNYEVVFVMMLKEDSDGWSAPVTFRLDLPNGNKQQHEESLLKKPRLQWFEIQVGEFMVEPKNDGIIKFMLGETNSGGWKRGLVVKGVVIRPKNFLQLKAGGAIPAKGKKVTLIIRNVNDLSRDVIKSDTASVKIPEIDLELAGGTLGGLVTTVEGLERVHGFTFGDSLDEDRRSKWLDFKARLLKLLNIEEPWTLILDDALANSFIAPTTDDIKDDFQLT
ncbi:unnamed protein product [Lactuca saligna]|uniref:Zinc finger ZPR1-type domain-containing protein n=1 Tax=Lactuca saligna TaxID=75948 RepID=A0AA35Z202_LACSI|nr:unnamed protein product [Lactuca saligna]